MLLHVLSEGDDALKLASLAALGAGSVRIRGLDITVRPPAQATLDVVYALFPRPIPPLGPDPSRGSLAPHIPQETAPEHVAAVRAWNQLTDRIEIALALDVEVDGLGRFADCRESSKQWCEKAAAEVSATFTREELVELAREIVRVSNTIEKDARKN
jgi:hypothetical protein